MTAMTVDRTLAQAFVADLDKINAAMRAAGAVVTEADGFQWIDEEKLPAALLSAHQGLVRFGYANGLLP